MTHTDSDPQPGVRILSPEIIAGLVRILLRARAAAQASQPQAPSANQE